MFRQYQKLKGWVRPVWTLGWKINETFTELYAFCLKSILSPPPNLFDYYPHSYIFLGWMSEFSIILTLNHTLWLSLWEGKDIHILHLFFTLHSYLGCFEDQQWFVCNVTSYSDHFKCFFYFKKRKVFFFYFVLIF